MKYFRMMSPYTPLTTLPPQKKEKCDVISERSFNLASFIKSSSIVKILVDIYPKKINL
jgi:hypothetical protein